MSDPIVLVLHGATPPALDGLLAETRRPVIRVQTDAPRGDFVTAPNEAYEFSGYQEGLGRALSLLPTDRPVSITFVNDTLVTGHPRVAARALLRALSRPPATAGAQMRGWCTPANEAMREVCGPQGYITTWAYTLVAPPAQLARVRFYSPHEVQARFDTVWAALPTAYRAWVDAWLSPTHALRGWYQAVPGQPLDEATRRRKRLSIYLEHTLPRRLADLGFETVDVGQRALRVLDRLHVNRLKLAHRLPRMLARAPS